MFIKIKDCNNELIFSKNDKEKFHDTDLLIFVRTDEVEGTLAYAYPC